MDGFAFVVLGLSLATAPIKLPKDVAVVRTRTFAMPLQWDPGSPGETESLRLFVSEDKGKTWKHKQDYKPTADRVTFTAAHDGLYWFALQILCRDGECVPAGVEEFAPAMKVYVNAERRAIKGRKADEGPPPIWHGQLLPADLPLDWRPWWEKRGPGRPHATGRP